MTMAFKKDLIRKLESFGKIVHTAFSDPDELRAFRRDKEVELVMRQLTGPRRGTSLILGPPGIGKTAIIHEVARRLAFRSSSPWMMLETSTSVLMSGTLYSGEWQTRFHDMLELATRKNRVILYVTDVPNLIGAGRHSRSDENMAASITPFIERNEVVLLGECDEEGFRTGVDRHAGFRKLFNVLQVRSQSDADVKAVIEEVVASRGRESKQNSEPSLTWQPEALTAVRQFGALYFPGIAKPGGAIQLVDHLITAKRSESVGKGRRPGTLPVARVDVVKSLHSFTGLPIHLIDDSQALKLAKVREFFESRVIGQDAALTAVVDLITLIKAGLTDPSKPLGTMMFVGPTGVGKTELAKALAEFIFGSSDRMIRLDMSEFKDYGSFEKLIGSQGAHDTQGKSGSLLDRVREQPFSVILLDEIEKAHPNVFDLLLQLFDDGRLTDAVGRTTDFTQTIIIMTSNLGGAVSDGMPFGFASDSNGEPDLVEEAVKEFFRPELVNRIGSIVKFQPLSREHVRILAQRELGSVLLRGGITRRQLRVDVDRGVIDVLADAGFDRQYGARPLKRAVERLALLPIARRLAESNSDNRPALLRLVPIGNRIELKIVHDRQARKSETLVEGVTLRDKVTAKKKKLSRKQIQAEMAEVQALVADLEEECEERELRQQRARLVEASATPNFWDNPPQAREILADLYRSERLIEGVSRLRRRADDVTHQLEAALKGSDERRLTTATRRIRELGQHAQLVQYSLRCGDRFDRCDAFVAMTAVGEPSEDIVGRLADMFSGWARRKGFEVKIAHEELISDKVTREVVLLIEGVAVYGLLCAEDGLHEFVYGRTSKAAKESHFAKVRVMAVLDDDQKELRELAVEKKTSRGKALRSGRYRSRVQVSHPAGGSCVKLHSALAVDEAIEIAKELLAADRRRTSGVPEPVNQPDEVVRRYTMRPSQSAKDLRTNRTTHNLGELWEGGLDEFLTAAIARRDA